MTKFLGFARLVSTTGVDYKVALLLCIISAAFELSADLGTLILPVLVSAAITKVTTVELKPSLKARIFASIEDVVTKKIVYHLFDDEVELLRCQDTILGDVDAQTRFEITSKQSNDPPLSRGYTLRSGEDSSVNAVRHMLMLPVQVLAAEEIIDFLKASSVHYALTVNPIIYTSCIEQFWATAKVQTVNGVRQLQALVDKKRVIITESSIRCDLHLEDAGGTDCLPTTTIFEELARMGYEKPSQKLTFYKAFFSPQWKYFIHTITQCLSAKSTAWNEFSNGGVKFLMYPRFLQVFINQQLGDMSQHKKIFVNPFHTKKVFANMKRAGKDFSRRITPLFDTMMVQASEEVGEDSDHLTDSN
ncbi:hypothetical protein Tco_0488761 [Tanacetum coccineum]